MSKHLLLPLIFVFTSCNLQINRKPSLNQDVDSNFPIIGGKFVLPKSDIAASTVGIYDQQNDFTCTATLLSENIAVTAAHCIESEPKHIQILFGSELSAVIESESPEARSLSIKTATAVSVHPLWTGEFNRMKDWADLALVQFPGKLPAGYKPVKWLTDEHEIIVGKNVTVAGFGATQVKIHHINEKKFPNLEKAITSGKIACDETFENEKRRCYRIEFLGDSDLKMTTARVESRSLSEVRLDESHGHGTCVGDSGGPAFIEKNGDNYWFGITSRGSDTCDGFGIYTNAIYFKTWIDEGIRLLSQTK